MLYFKIIAILQIVHGLVILQCNISRYTNGSVTFTSTMVSHQRPDVEYNDFAYLNLPASASSKIKCFGGTDVTACTDYGVQQLSYVKDGVVYLAINTTCGFPIKTNFSCLIKASDIPTINSTTIDGRCDKSTGKKNSTTNQPVGNQTNSKEGWSILVILAMLVVLLLLHLS